MSVKPSIAHKHPIYWLGGGSGSGKTTLSKILAKKHGLILHDTDLAMADHGARAKPEDTPYLEAFKAMDMDERWLTRPPQDMLDSFHWFQGEMFEMIIEDIGAENEEGPIIVEGFRLLPEKLAPYLRPQDRALWLLPTPEFRRHAFEKRGFLWQIPNKTSNPEKALDNFLSRDALFTKQLEKSLIEQGLPYLVIDGTQSIEEISVRVEKAFDLGV